MERSGERQALGQRRTKEQGIPSSMWRSVWLTSRGRGRALVGGRMAYGKRRKGATQVCLELWEALCTWKWKKDKWKLGQMDKVAGCSSWCRSSPHCSLTSAVGFPGPSSLTQLRGFCFINTRILIKLSYHIEAWTFLGRRWLPFQISDKVSNLFLRGGGIFMKLVWAKTGDNCQETSSKMLLELPIL